MCAYCSLLTMAIASGKFVSCTVTLRLLRPYCTQSHSVDQLPTFRISFRAFGPLWSVGHIVIETNIRYLSNWCSGFVLVKRSCSAAWVQRLPEPHRRPSPCWRWLDELLLAEAPHHWMLSWPWRPVRPPVLIWDVDCPAWWSYGRRWPPMFDGLLEALAHACTASGSGTNWSGPYPLSEVFCYL